MTWRKTGLGGEDMHWGAHHTGRQESGKEMCVPSGLEPTPCSISYGWDGEKEEAGNFPEGQLQEGLGFEDCGWEFIFLWHPTQDLASSSYPGSIWRESEWTWKAFGNAERQWRGLVRAGLQQQPAWFKSQFYLLFVGSVTWDNFLASLCCSFLFWTTEINVLGLK